MKFPVSMLHDFVKTSLTAEQLGDLLTMAGFELEGIEEVEGEAVLDIKVVSNRGDGLSVFGLSREVLAKDASSEPTDLYRQAVAGFAISDESSADAVSLASVDIQTEACTRYAARLFRGTNNSESPEWLQRRLRQAGMRPLGVLVDLTNYVMLEMGQPLHAFDHDTLDGGRIVVRGANPGEKLTTLNGVEHELQPHHMMICDASRAVAVAGVMGGAETEVGANTKNVLLESAHFVNTSVRKTRKELGLSTDASYRFERSVDPEGVVRGLNRYAQLLAQIQGEDSRVAGVIDVYPLPRTKGQVTVRVSRACLLLGMEVTTAEVKSYLERLGFSVSGDGEPFVVESPTWRPDIVREEDLVEEIGRVHGYDRIPTLPPAGSTPVGGLHGVHLAKEQAKNAMLRCGFVQTISQSLRDKHPLDSPNLESIGPKNPGSPEMAYLRSSLWPSLADAARRNGGRDVHLFEIGRVHGLQGGQFVEGQRLAALSTGKILPDAWTGKATLNADFFSLKGAVEASMSAMGRTPSFAPSSTDPRLHPTQQADVLVNGVRVGTVGKIHPQVAEDAGLSEDTFLSAIDLELAFAQPADDLKLHHISRNPAVRRDISVLIPKDVPYETIERDVTRACDGMLEKMWLFDVYAGKGIPEGSHSISIALQLRKSGENFTDEEANQVRDAAVAALAALGGAQR